MPKKTYFSIKNWEEYQHGSGKTRHYPWLKLYGSLFRRHWFIQLSEKERYWTLCLLDYARENDNQIPKNLEIFSKLYHIFYDAKLFRNWHNSLIENGFLASTMLADCYQDASSIREEKIREDKNKRDSIKSFKKPSIEEVRNYISESRYHVDAEEFFDYYESTGWMRGKNKMKDWKATIRTWNRKNGDSPFPKQTIKSTRDHLL